MNLYLSVVLTGRNPSATDCKYCQEYKREHDDDDDDDVVKLELLLNNSERLPHSISHTCLWRPQLKAFVKTVPLSKCAT